MQSSEDLAGGVGSAHEALGLRLSPAKIKGVPRLGKSIGGRKGSAGLATTRCAQPNSVGVRRLSGARALLSEQAYAFSGLEPSPCQARAGPSLRAIALRARRVWIGVHGRETRFLRVSMGRFRIEPYSFSYESGGLPPGSDSAQSDRAATTMKHTSPLLAKRYKPLTRSPLFLGR